VEHTRYEQWDPSEHGKEPVELQLARERDKLRLNDAVHEATLEAAAQGILVVDRNLEIASLNRRFIQLWRIPEDMAARRDRDELLSFISKQVFDPVSYAARIAYLYEHLTERSVDVVHCTDGRVFERTSAPVLVDGHVPFGRVWFFRDISQDWEREQRLLAVVAEAEEAARAKSEFLANMSHELRTPLNAILGFSRVLQRTAAPQLQERHQNYLEYIAQSGEHMLQLVNDLLDLRVLEEHELELVPVDLCSVAREATDIVNALADEKKLRLAMCVSEDLARVRGHRRAIMQILINLLSNAIKFTPEGGAVTVSAKATGNEIKLSVQDTGVGISKVDQRRLFTYFEQLGAKHQHNMKGSGLGLALTKALVLKQRGTIRVHSAPGEGSTFEVAFEVAQ
jgi:signal transduction histidine kinase